LGGLIGFDGHFFGLDFGKVFWALNEFAFTSESSALLRSIDRARSSRFRIQDAALKGAATKV
jgi:hypothetical protein